MKQIMIKIVLIQLIAIVVTACDSDEEKQQVDIANNNSSITISVEVPEPPVDTEIISPIIEKIMPSQNKLSEMEALELIESKLSQEDIRISYLALDGTDELGNYIIRQASSATTVVMEWYYVNPITQEISCSFSEKNCLEEEVEEVNVIIEPLTVQQLDAVQIAQQYAQENFPQESGYIDGITYVIYDHEDDKGNMVIWIYNPGSGGSNTIDWLTVNSQEKQVISSFSKYISDNEYKKYTEIYTTLKENKPYEINISNSKQSNGLIKYDINKDRLTEFLRYSIISGTRDGYDIPVQKCQINVTGYTIEIETKATNVGVGIESIGLVDLDTSDDYIEFYIKDGNTDGGVTRIFRLLDNGIKEIEQLTTQ